MSKGIITEADQQWMLTKLDEKLSREWDEIASSFPNGVTRWTFSDREIRVETIPVEAMYHRTCLGCGSATQPCCGH